MEKTLIEARRDSLDGRNYVILYQPRAVHGNMPLARDENGNARWFRTFEEAEQICRTYIDVHEQAPCESTWDDQACRWVGPDESDEG